MPAHKLVSERQMAQLVDFMEKNKGFAVGRHNNSGPSAKGHSGKKWEELAAILNSGGAGCTRTPKKWRDYWYEKKYMVRRKASDLRMHAHGTGGGPPKKWVLTPIEERILAILGKVAVHGNASVRIPFDLNIPSALPPSQDALGSSSLGVNTSELTPVPTSIADSVPGPSSASTLAPESRCTVTPAAAFAPAPAVAVAPISLQPFSPPACTGHRRPSMSSIAQNGPSAPNIAPAPPSPPPSSSHQRPSNIRLPNVPQWAYEMEERRLAVEQEHARAMASIAESLAGMRAEQTAFMDAQQRSLARIAELLEATLGSFQLQFQ